MFLHVQYATAGKVLCAEGMRKGCDMSSVVVHDFHNSLRVTSCALLSDEKRSCAQRHSNNIGENVQGVVSLTGISDVV